MSQIASQLDAITKIYRCATCYGPLVVLCETVDGEDNWYLTCANYKVDHRGAGVVTANTVAIRVARGNAEVETAKSLLAGTELGDELGIAPPKTKEQRIAEFEARRERARKRQEGLG
jgi:hypothetical protein